MRKRGGKRGKEVGNGQNWTEIDNLSVVKDIDNAIVRISFLSLPTQ